MIGKNEDHSMKSKYIYLLFFTSFLFSLVGTFIKLSRQMVEVETITFSRFFIGVLCLLSIALISKRKLTLLLTNPWIWIGVFGKCLNYILENYAVSKGFSYGNIVVWPCQAIFIAIISVLFLKETITRWKAFAMILCSVGICIISWNGVSLEVFCGSNFIILLLFVISSFGASLHFLSQKMLIEKTDSINLNINIFALCSLFTAIPATLKQPAIIHFNPLAVVGLISLGLITGIGFLLTANAIKEIPLYLSSIIQNTAVIFTLLWAVLFFDEKLTVYTISGSAIFITGLLIINYQCKKEDA